MYKFTAAFVIHILGRGKKDFNMLTVNLKTICNILKNCKTKKSGYFCFLDTLT